MHAEKNLNDLRWNLLVSKNPDLSGDPVIARRMRTAAFPGEIRNRVFQYGDFYANRYHL